MVFGAWFFLYSMLVHTSAIAHSIWRVGSGGNHGGGGGLILFSPSTQGPQPNPQTPSGAQPNQHNPRTSCVLYTAVPGDRKLQSTYSQPSFSLKSLIILKLKLKSLIF
jgi:hypothetical protein